MIPTEKKQNSELKLSDWDYLNKIVSDFGCCKLFVNDICVWDDAVEVSEYVPYTDALNNFFEEHAEFKNSYIKTIDIDIVHFHHSIIYLGVVNYGK